MKKSRKDIVAINKYIGGKVKQARVEKGVSANDFHIALETSIAQVFKYENGNTFINSGLLFKMSVILGLPIEYFFQGMGQEIKYEPLHTIRKRHEISDLWRDLNKHSQQVIYSLMKLLKQAQQPSGKSEEKANDKRD